MSLWGLFLGVVVGFKVSGNFSAIFIMIVNAEHRAYEGECFAIGDKH